MLAAALLLVSLPASCAPVWLGELGLSERGGALVYTRRHPRTGEAAESILSADERRSVEAALGKIPDDRWQVECAALLKERLARDKIPPQDTVWFDEKLALTRAGKEAVPGVLLDDPYGRRFKYSPDEKPERFELPRVSLDHARVQAALDRLGREASVLDLGRTEGAQPAEPVRVELPPESARERLKDFAFTLPRRPYTLEQAGAQWRRWTAKAEAWRNDEHLRRLYGGDVGRYWGAPSSPEIIALVDPVVTALDQTSPNALTRLITRGAREYEELCERVPIQLRDDFLDYMARWRARDDSAQDLRLFNEAVGLEPPIERSGALKLKSDASQAASWLWDAFHPRMSLRVSPRLGLSTPSATLGARFSADYGSHWRLRCGGDYDTKDRSVQGYGAIGCDW